MLISIIVPVYNAEKFLLKCLDSIRNQTYQNLEIILVNDGSTDYSGKICEKYSKKDKRFIVIHKENGGVSSARNIALNKIRGEYVGFVDSDDWIEPNMFEKLYKNILNYNADTAICGFVKENLESASTIKKSNSIIKLNSKQALNQIIDSDGFRGFLWNKLFSVDLIKKHNIRFDENIHFCEDLLFCCQYMSKSKCIIYDTTPYYHYIIHEENVTKSVFSYKKITSLVAIGKIIDFLNEENYSFVNKFKDYFMHMNISLLMNGINENKLNEKYYMMLRENLFKYKISELCTQSVKISCAVARINIKLCYLLWKLVEIGNKFKLI